VNPVAQASEAGPLEDASRRGPDFIGIGAQRTGTSWIYACLYEHPEICMPQKEINFFSRAPHWNRGLQWYESIFGECSQSTIAGEFSTSYLTDRETPGRIRERYPDARLIVSLRHPADRAFSSYLNDIVAGAVDPTTGFGEALPAHPEYVDGGRYALHLRRYLDLFPREQVLISLFEDARRDPLSAVRAIYSFLGVDPDFRPAMVDRRVGAGRIPKSQRIERWLLGASAAVRRRRASRSVWWIAKRAGLGDRIRALNTRGGEEERRGLDPVERRDLIRELEPDIGAVEGLLGRELPEWRR
jgi:Sulfotransferase domain